MGSLCLRFICDLTADPDSAASPCAFLSVYWFYREGAAGARFPVRSLFPFIFPKAVGVSLIRVMYGNVAKEGNWA
uniref:Uncharacterized protein n=1 Tax=uncultured prokaryote TaxID=198431 RepID=A0A0H5QN62_9ZZZZ|nr:hypothetical protein [uncultured prokaryote]